MCQSFENHESSAAPLQPIALSPYKLCSTKSVLPKKISIEEPLLVISSSSDHSAISESLHTEKRIALFRNVIYGARFGIVIFLSLSLFKLLQLDCGDSETQRLSNVLPNARNKRRLLGFFRLSNFLWSRHCRLCK